MSKIIHEGFSRGEKGTNGVCARRSSSSVERDDAMKDNLHQPIVTSLTQRAEKDNQFMQMMNTLDRGCLAGNRLARNGSYQVILSFGSFDQRSLIQLAELHQIADASTDLHSDSKRTRSAVEGNSQVSPRTRKIVRHSRPGISPVHYLPSKRYSVHCESFGNKRYSCPPPTPVQRSPSEDCF